MSRIGAGIIRYLPIATASSDGVSVPGIAVPSEITVSGVGFNTRVSPHTNASSACPFCYDFVSHWPSVRNNSTSLGASNRNTVSDRAGSDGSASEDDFTPLKKRPKSAAASKPAGGAGARRKQQSAAVAFAAPVDSQQPPSGLSAVPSSKGSSDTEAVPQRGQKIMRTGRALFQQQADSTKSGRGHDSARDMDSYDVAPADSNRVDLNSSVSELTTLVGAPSRKSYDELMSALNAALDEKDHAQRQLEMVIRKSDRRLQEEKRLRKEWNITEQSMETEKQELQKRMHALESENMKLQKDALKHLELAAYLTDCMRSSLRDACVGARPLAIESEYNAHSASSSSSNSSSISSRHVDSTKPSAEASSPGVHSNTGWRPAGMVAASPQQLLRDPAKLICVVCLSDRADMVFTRCGHLCICKTDYELLFKKQNAESSAAKKCPLCNALSESVVQVVGL
jgi:hypothetical protein